MGVQQVIFDGLGVQTLPRYPAGYNSITMLLCSTVDFVQMAHRRPAGVDYVPTLNSDVCEAYMMRCTLR